MKPQEQPDHRLPGVQGEAGSPERADTGPDAFFELESQLEEAHTRIRQLTEELEATNQGVIALHAELEQAREAEAYLVAIVRSSDDAMYSINTDEIVTSWNHGAERMFGYNEQEMVGRPVRDLMPKEARGEFEVAVKGLKSGERVAPYDSWRLRQDGSQVEVNITLSAMRSPSGQLMGYSAVVADITDRRRAEEDLALARAETEVFAERERIARDLHDLVIQRLFASGLALQSALSLSPRPEVYERIERVIDDLDTTVREIRSTIFALQQSAQTDTSLRSQLLGLVSSLEPLLGFRPRVHFEGPIDTLVPVRVAEHLLAVVREALSNAGRHANASSVVLDLEVGAELLLVITDDGRGMGQTDRRSGLANLAERASILGGSFVVSSTPGQGTRLEWRVPLAS